MMDIANDSIYPNLEEMINDMCDVFTSTPYFHIGGDEVQLEMIKDAIKGGEAVITGIQNLVP